MGTKGTIKKVNQSNDEKYISKVLLFLTLYIVLLLYILILLFCVLISFIYIFFNFYLTI